jgi:hypothetical protein
MTTPLFLHIEHTGGTTLHDILMRQYGRGLHYIARPAYVEQFMALPMSQKAQMQAVWGHFSYGLHRHMPQPTQYYTLMREPVSRAIASYHYLLRRTSGPNYQRYASGEVTWDDHAALPWVSQTQIGRMIGGDDAELVLHRPSPIGPAALEQAQAHIEAQFAFVGLTEYYDESLLLMARLCGWTKPLFYVRRNVGTRKDAPDHIRQRLYDSTAAERALYAWVKARFLALVEAQGPDFARQVAEFKAANARYGAWQARIERMKARIRPLWRALRRR